MINRIGAIVALIALAACSGGATGSGPALPSRDLGLMSKGSANWTALDSQTVQPSGGAVAAFGFAVRPNSRLLITQNDPSKNPFLGNHAGQTISATVSVTGLNPGATFTYDTTNNPCGTPASVRLFFTSTGGPFAYTNYWWSHVGAAQLSALTGATPGTLTDTLVPGDWTDWNGQSSVDNAAAFTAAASNITSIGLSFGGGCFFENGVGTSDGSGVFVLRSFTVQ